MAKRRLMDLRVSGQTSIPERQNSTRTGSWTTTPLFDYSALEDSASPRTKTITPKQAKRGISPRERAQQRIIREKLGGSYIPLVCEHYTTYDDQRAYTQHAPRGKYYCDPCGAWRRRRPKPRYTVPDVPPY